MSRRKGRSRIKRGDIPAVDAILAARDADDLRRMEEDALKSVGHRDVKSEKSSKRGGPSKVERAYAAHLEALKAAGEILSYCAQPDPIEIAHRCTYRPDFLVVPLDRIPYYVETKGRKGSRPWYRDDGARVKTKVAARELRSRHCGLGPEWYLVVVWPRKGGGWCQERVKP